MMLLKCCTQYDSKLGKAVATGPERVSFHSCPKKVKSESRSIGSDSLQPCGLYNCLPKLEIEPRFSALRVDSLPAEPQAKANNTGMDSLSFLQWIFPTQELKRSPALQADTLPTEL